MKKRMGESGNIFFTLFGAVALVGVVGAATSTLMRGPVGTVVALNQRAKADSQMQIAMKLAMLEAQNNSNDCDLDTFIEPVGAGAPIAGLTGGGRLPQVGSTTNDPWGSPYGYCGWNHGMNTTSTCSGGATPLLRGHTSGQGTVIAVLSAGPDRTFGTTCVDNPGVGPYITKTVLPGSPGNDDLIVSMTYSEANEASGGLWSISSTDPDAITTNRSLDVSTGAQFSSGDVGFTNTRATFGTGSTLDFTGGGLFMLPNECQSASCGNPNKGLMRRFTNGTCPAEGTQEVLQICDGAGWLDIGGAGAIVAAAGNPGEIQYNAAGLMGASSSLIFNSSNGLTVGGDSIFSADLRVNQTMRATTLNVSGNSILTGTLDVNGAADFNSTIDVALGATFGSWLRGSDGTSTAPTYSFTSDNDSGMFFSSSALRFSVDGTERMAVSAGGVTMTAGQTVGNFTVGGTLTTNDLSVTNNITANRFISRMASTSVAAPGFETEPGTGMYSAVDNTLTLVTGGTSRIVIDGTGDVGIGVLSPDAKLDVGGEIKVGTSNVSCGPTLHGAIRYVSGDLLQVCSSVTGIWEDIGTSGGGGGGAASYWTRISSVDRRLYYDDAFVGVGTNNPLDDFHVAGDLLVTGSYTGTASIGVSGAGARMFFDPESSAFRAGGVSGGQWDAGVIGGYSVALGYNVQASGLGSRAMGTNSLASGDGSLAIGEGVQATNLGSAALGLKAVSSGLRSSIWSLGDATGASPIVSGTESFVTIMGDQSGVNMTANQTWALLGGRMLIDQTPSTNPAVSGTLSLDVEGGVGAMQYCDENGVNCFTAASVATGGVTAPGNNRELIYNSGGVLGANPNMSFSSAGNLTLGGTGAIALPSGDGTNRPVASANGMLRYNTALGRFEGYQGGQWRDLITGTALAAGVNTQIQFNSGGYFGAVPAFTFAQGEMHVDGTDYGRGGVLRIRGAETPAANYLDATMILESTASGSIWSQTLASNNPARNGDLVFAHYNGSVWTEPLILADDGRIGIFSTHPRASLDINTTDAILLPVGSVGNRPAVPVDGMIRYNSQNGKFEGFQQGSWQDILTGAAGGAAGANTQIQYNSNGSLWASPSFTWDGTTNTLNVQGPATFGTANITDGSITTAGILNIVPNGAGQSKLIMNNVSDGNSLGIEFINTGTNSTDWEIFVAGNNFTGSNGADPQEGNFTIIDKTMDEIRLIVSKNTGNVAIGGDTPQAKLDVQGSGAVLLPRGITGNRPAGIDGMIRYNSQSNRFEGHQAGAWQDLVTIGTTPGASAPNRGIQFNSGGSFAAVPDFVYSSTGNLGVGTATPTQKLDVAGNIAIPATGVIYSGAKPMLSANEALGNMMLTVNVYGDIAHNATGTNNTLLGYGTGETLTIGTGNTLVGTAAGYNSTTYDSNTLVGNNAGTYVAGSYNAVLGARALQYANTGVAESVYLGYAAGGGSGSDSAGGLRTVAIGAYAGMMADGANNIFMGYDTGRAASTGADNILIGTSLQLPTAVTNNYLNIGGLLTGTTNAGLLAVNGTGALTVPRGTTGNRPAGIDGMIRYNSQSGKFEGHQGGTWQDILTSAVSGGAASPNRGIQFNSGGSFAATGNLQYTSAGALLLSGNYTGTGTEPVAGAGTRMFFDPQKAAFRAGSVTGNQWNYTSVGNYSAAMGSNTIASGDYSTAWGGLTTASGWASTAMGNNTAASGSYSTAMGNLSYAMGDYSTAIGRLSVAKGINSIAMGNNATAESDYSTAIGRAVTAYGAQSLSMGYSTTASGITSTAMGRSVIAGNNVIGSGFGDGSFALGLIDDAVTITTRSQVTGIQSYGIFMGAQDGLVMSANNTMGLFGGQLVIDPRIPAQQLSARGVIDVGAATDAIVLPRGTTAQQPAGVNGMLRYNSQTGRFEGYQSGAWQDILTSGVSGGAASPNRGIQFNSGGNFAASADFVYTSTGTIQLSTADYIPLSMVGTSDAWVQLTGVSGRAGVIFKPQDSDALGWNITSDATNGLLFKQTTNADSGTNIIRMGQDGIVRFTNTNAIQITAGDTSQRPTSSVNGMLRYNSQTGKFEGYQGGSWQDIVTGAATSTFLSLSDTPASYAGQANKFVRVNAGTTALEFTDEIVPSVAGQPAPTGTILDDLGDVTIALPTAGQILTYSSGQWINAAAPVSGGIPAGANTQLQFNSNGAFGAVSNLTWNVGTTTLGVTGRINVSDRINIAGQAGNAPVGASLSGLSDVTIAGASAGQILTYSGGQWINATAAGGSASAAGVSTNIQFNSGGNMGADSTFVYTASGNLGVGTSSPAAKITAHSTSAVGNTVLEGLRLVRENTAGNGANNIGNSMGFFAESSNGTMVETARIESVLYDANNNSKDSNLRFYTLGANATSGTTTPTESMRIDSRGTLYAGRMTNAQMTTAQAWNWPTLGMAMWGRDIGMTGEGSAASDIYLEYYGDDGAWAPEIIFYRNRNTQATPYWPNANDSLGRLSFTTNGLSNGAVGRIEMKAAATHNTGTTPGVMEFYTTPTGSLVPLERMSIKDNGRVQIGIGTPAALLDVNGAIQIGNSGETCSSAADRGSIRYNTGEFEVCRDHAVGWAPLVPTGPVDAVCDASHTFSTPGTFGYRVPANFGTLTIRMWGGGGGGGGAAFAGGTNGSTGQQSGIASQGLTANGGVGGGWSSGTPGTGGAGGTASGGDTNTNGNAGSAGVNSTSSGAGGNAPGPGGGAGGAARPYTTGSGNAGGAPGGGGSGGVTTVFSAEGGGGGSGGYVEKILTTVDIAPGAIISDVIVGGGGAAGSGGGNNGGAGGDGRVTFICASGPPNMALNDLNDVTITAPSNGQTLFYSNGQWVNGVAGGGSAAGTNTQLQFNSGGSFGAVSNLTWNGTTFAVVGDVTYTGTITDVSDMRLKNNILPLNDRGSMLGKLDQIGTYSFTMKDDQNGRVEFGVMAQEINKVFPELVKIDESTAEKYMSVNYVGLIAPLIEASKELKSENESLKAQISTIEERMASIEGDMNGMKVHTGYGISKAQMGLGMVLGMILMGGMAGVAMIVVNRRRRQG